MVTESFVFTIFFLVLGPVKIIPAFAKLTYSMPLKFKRQVAMWGILIAAGICAYVGLLGRGILRSYQISLAALLIAGGIVLLLSALNIIFPKPSSTPAPKEDIPAVQLAISPVATPVIVPPVAIAAILFFVMLSDTRPDLIPAIFKAMLTMLGLDFLVMFFIDRIIKIRLVMMLLQVFGSVLVFFQVALAIQAILSGLARAGLLKSVP
jgi:multiple antibiotic resistance protein